MKLAHTFYHFFTPRHTNNHRAKLLHTSSILVLCFSFITAQVTITALSRYTKSSSSVLGYASQISKDEVIRLTNLKRAENGVGPVKENSSLSSGALSKGQNMLSLGYWAHIAPDGTEPWKFFGDVGYKYRYAGENLARDFSSAQAAVDAWMASPTHRDNMLSPKYSEIGIGIVEGDLAGSDSTIIVQFFGAPLGGTTATAANPPPPVETIAQVQPLATPVPVEIPQTLVAGSEQTASPFSLTRTLSIGLVAVLLLAFIVDLVVVSRNRITRRSGRSFAHLAFLGMTLGIVLIIQAGQIL